MTATVIWRPEPLTAKLIAAARPAAQDFARAAMVRAPSRKIVVSARPSGTSSYSVVTNQLGRFFESGTHPHKIEPKRKVLRLADGRFVTGPVQHLGMRAQPFIRPTFPLWPSLYRRRAAGAFRGV